MFQIGDKVVYPMHGAGIIEAIEEKEILGEKQLYYVLNMPLKNMQVMIPMAKTSNLGLRQVVGSDILEKVLKNINDGKLEPISNPMQRHRVNMTKMKSGDIYEGVEVIKDLMYLEKSKKLATGDKVMLDNARHMLISELVLVKGIEEDQAANLLNQVINA
ncbi:CarD family transcriptional regulator [Ammoniphilus sp. YIM 78166]|uniref:CarD family transcriptional regulator n=1 Tax=Ammoniphilus sp. YIM 78166 TaxID=1644106 RepID=UPI00106F7E44|nr:CarD family transcriptional regulator [Ammoniphilus sp. YIM 78166]